MPNTFDLPIDKLRTYSGTNPRPADFDRYWDESLAEMEAVPPRLELRPAKVIESRVAECFDLYFTGIGGARIHAKFLKPAGRSGPLPAIVEFHGYSSGSADWASFLPYVAEGFCVAALDCRGQGGTSEDNHTAAGCTLRGHIIRGVEDPDPKKLMYRGIFLDTARLARLVMGLPEVDAERVGAIGASQGGALALVCAALEPRIARTVSVYPFLCDYRRVWEMDVPDWPYEELRLWFRWRDPRHLRAAEFFERLGYIDVQHLAPRIRGDVLMMTGLMDTVCPPSTQFAAFNKIVAPKRHEIFPDFAHEPLPGGADLAFRHLMGLRRA